MKQVFALLAIVGAVTLCSAVQDFFYDDEGLTYTIGVLGNRVYTDSDDGYRSAKVPADMNILKFAMNFFKNVDAEENNVVVAPLSPQMLLSFIAGEAKGVTKNEIVDAIGYENSQDLERLVTKMQKEPSSHHFKIGNGFFVKDDKFDKIKESFWHKDQKDRWIDVVKTPFQDSKKAKRSYKKWVSEKTNGLIKNVDIDFTPDTKLVLGSTLYFKGQWLHDFNKTVKGDFKLLSGEVVQVDVMKVRKKFHAGKFDQMNAKWGIIPYSSTEAMMIVLPTGVESLDEVIDKMEPEDIKDIINIATSSMTDAFLNVSLPKFTIKSNIDLKTPLAAMNVKEIFTRNADFSLFNDIKERLIVSKAKQETVLEVNEEGSIGASTSTFSVTGLSIQPTPNHSDFIIDRPFAAFIIDRKYTVPYFMAKVFDPRI